MSYGSIAGGGPCDAHEVETYRTAPHMQAEDPHASASHPPPAGGARRRIGAALLAACGAAVAVGLSARGFTAPPRGQGGTPPSPSALDALPTTESRGERMPAAVATSSSPAAAELVFAVSNQYTSVDGAAAMYDGYPWEFIVEPHTATTLSVAGGAAGSSYSWQVDGHAIHGDGASVVHTFGTRWYAKSYHVAVTEQRDGRPTRHFETEVMCKYVRREIRSLTDADRAAYFDAHQVMYALSEDEGQQKYGPLFRSKDYFNRKHAGMPGCSAYHKGAQFIPTHMALTLEFEQSLQSVNPAVTVPYWDWTIDDASLGGAWRTSLVFDDDWFGSADPANDDSVVDAGRWAYTPIMTKAWAYSQKTNPYGYLTDAWNMIKKPYLSRSSQIFGVTNTQPLPTCGDHYMCLSLDNWMDFTDCLENYAHENVHQLLGGVTHSEHTLERLMGRQPQYRKLYLWLASRADRTIMALHSKRVMECPDYCALDAPFSECKCSCPSLEEDVDSDTLAYLKDDLGVFTFLSYRQYTEPYAELISARNASGASVDDVDIESIKEMLKLYCNPGMIGDQYTSFATNDPAFWPIHPTLERLWHLKRLAGNASFDETWEDVEGCPGHNPHDLQPFERLVGEKSKRHYSNKMLYDLFDPRNPELPYLYDQYSWPHCLAKGLDFAAAAENIPNAGLYAGFSVYSERIKRLNSTATGDDTNATSDAAATQVRLTS